MECRRDEFNKGGMKQKKDLYMIDKEQRLHNGIIRTARQLTIKKNKEKNKITVTQQKRNRKQNIKRHPIHNFPRKDFWQYCKVDVRAKQIKDTT